MLNDIERQDYIAALELSDLPHRITGRTLTMNDEKPEGYVDAGSLVCFVDKVSDGTKADVLNSTLLAQLAANKKFDRENQTVDWYKKYREVLENIGWTLSAFEFTKYSAGGASFQIKTAVIQLLAALMSENPLAIAKSTLAAVESLGTGDDRVALFSSSSSTPTAGNFQIGTVSETNGTPTFQMGAFYFKSHDVKVSFLWSSFNFSDTELYQGSQTLTLSEDVYARVRQQIIDKLGDRAVEYVSNLDI